MKKRIIGIGIIAILIIMLVILTGCGSIISEKSNGTVENITQISDKYVFISKNGNDYELRDLNGNFVLTLPSGYEPKSKVINGYFFVSQLGDTKLYLYDIQGNEIFSGKDLAPFTAYTGDKITNDNYIYMVRVNEEKNTINGKEEISKMYSLSDNLKDVTNDYVYGEHSSNMKDKYQVYTTVIVSNPTFVSNPSEPSKYNGYYLKENNGFFVHIKDEKQLYEPIEGEAILNEGSTTEVLAKIDGKYYIVSENGDKKELTYMPNDNSYVTEFYDGYVITKSSSSIDDIRAGNYKKSESHLYDPNGNEIEFK